MSVEHEYVPPRVWTWEQPNGGTWAHINRPTSGATHETVLPQGQHPFQLYSMGTGNGQKITIMFEELLGEGIAGAEYDAWMIDIAAADQFGSGFVAINPNSKIPALLDCSGEVPIRVFESGAILLHLAEKFGRFVPRDPAGRAELLSWLFWQVGSAPFLPGGLGHFYKYAPVKIEYAINRYAMEVKRQLHVLDQRLEGRAFILGTDISIADFAILPWYGAALTDPTFGLAEFLGAQEYPNVLRWAHAMLERPGVQRGRRVNRTGDALPGLVRERHAAADLAAT